MENKLTFEDMKKKLQALYDKQKSLEDEIERLILLREQTIDDIELAETMCMYRANREDRIKEYGN